MSSRSGGSMAVEGGKAVVEGGKCIAERCKRAIGRVWKKE
jgi:hypothetical protein